ncbi:MAG: hypothetical protein DME32_13350 [Verrucomicrobia bacterium]|nr:MAG: hypothetical protein DME32_13350 [Verrucomicrobiota bacterium]
MKSQLETLDLLFPRVRAEILRLLFSQTKIKRYVCELMRMSGLALRTMQEGACHAERDRLDHEPVQLISSLLPGELV